MRTWADVNLAAVRQNAERLSERLNGSQLIAVVKANGYGHGAVRIARALQGVASRFAVVSPDEALELRTGGVGEPIIVLGPLQTETAAEAFDANAEVCLSTLDDARMLAAATIQRRRRLSVHLKVDSGMNRCGTRPDELGALLDYLSTRPLIRPVGVWTHFAASDDPNDPLTREQFAAFTATLARYGLSSLFRHAANSGAVLNFPDTALDAARVGISLFGLYPSAATPRDVPLTPALAWKASINRVSDAHPGETVSYGRHFAIERESRLATLAVGYADGYPRLASNRGCVLIRGRRAPICGSVCMDSLVCDVTEIPDVAYGDTATLVGSDGSDRIHADELAGWAETISYEILTRIGKRVKRQYHGSEPTE